MNLQIPQFVLFDQDGTLLDSLPGIACSVNYACRSVDLPEPALDLRGLLGPPIRTILSKVAQTNDAGFLDRLESAFRSHYDTEGWRKTSSFEGVHAALEALKTAGHRLFVVTNKPRHISLRILEREALLPFFERIYTPDSRQPPYVCKAEMLRSFLDDFQTSPSNCLMVGDTMDDITAAAANQMAAAFVEHGYGELPLHVPVRFRLRSVSDFLACLTTENAK